MAISIAPTILPIVLGNKNNPKHKEVKNKIGRYYAFNEKNVLVITDIKKHQEILTSYKFVNPNLIITENSVQEFYKIELLNATQMVLVDKNGLIDLPMKLYFIKKTISP